MKTSISIFVAVVLATVNLHATENASQPESKADSKLKPKPETKPVPGPENGGLRMRLVVTPRARAHAVAANRDENNQQAKKADAEGFDVQLELVNVSKRKVTLRATWAHNHANGVGAYVEAATSIESVPAVKPWMGGVMAGRRTLPQPEYVLEAGKTLSVSWQTQGRFLKNRVTNPNDVQNPKFPFPGLYSVHATLNIIANDKTIALRSNEQLVPVGGSHALPKSTHGRLLFVNAETMTARMSLGALQKVRKGDVFELHTKRDHWKLTITQAELDHSVGLLESLLPGQQAVPVPGTAFTLVQGK